MLVNYGKGNNRGSAFPLSYTLRKAVGALTLHTGVGTKSLYSQS